MLEVRLLGQFGVRLNGESIEMPSRPAQSLFAYLILNPGVVHRREMLAGMLWPDSTETNARGYLRHALWHLRQAIGDSYLSVDNISIAFNAEDADFGLDVSLVDQEFAPGVSLETLVDSISQYGGDLLPGFYDDWVTLERERVQAVFERNMDLLLVILVEQQRWREVLKWGEHWIALGRAPEPAYRAIMEAYCALGNHSGVAAIYKRCEKALRDDLDIEPSELTQATYQRLLERSVTPGTFPGPVQPGVDSFPPTRSNLPAQATPFVGRREELSKVGELLREPTCRLLTLVGPGGIGKTRLALQAAEQHDGYEHGRWFVPLSGVNSPTLLAPAIAEALRLSFYGREDPTAQLLNFLTNRELLIILDSFEHLLAGVGLVADILQAAPRITILTTSRERLNLQGEWLYQVDGMAFPEGHWVDDAESYDAISLFIQSACRLDPHFSIRDDDRPHIQQICRMVEGMPLAIELAAAWVRNLSCCEITEEISQNLDFLSVSLRDMPARHQSLRAVFDHSWSLLTGEEQQAFRRLSVFRSGFSREAAQEVAGARLLTLSALVDKSFLRWTPQGRYEVHGALRQYGAEKLNESSAEREAAADLHARYFAAFLSHKRDHLTGDRYQETLEEIDNAIDDCRAAWHWAIERRSISELDSTLESLFAYYVSRGWFQEGESAIRGAVEWLRHLEKHQVSEKEMLLCGRCLARLGYLRASLGHYDEAESLLQEALSIAQDIDAKYEIAFALDALGSLAWDQGDYFGSKKLHQESLAIRREIRDNKGRAVSLDHLGVTHMMLGSFQEAEASLQESVAIARELGDQMGIASPLGNLGWVAYIQRDYEAARELLEESVAISERYGHRRAMALYSTGLSLAMSALGDHVRAIELARASLSTAREIGEPLAIALALGGLGEALRAEGRTQQAHGVLCEGFKTASEFDLVPMLLLLLIAWASVLAQQGDDLQAVRVLAMIIHDAKGLGGFQEVAEYRIAQMESRVAPEKWAITREEGQAMDLQEYVADVIEDICR